MNQFGFENGASADPALLAAKDEEHLNLLRIFYFVMAGKTALFVLLGLAYAAIGLLILTPSMRHAPPSAGPIPFMVPGLFAFLGLSFAAFFSVAAVLQFLTAQRLKARRSRTFCLVTAGLTCMEMPYGTALGAFTFIVLDRPSVRRQFVD
jgi:hypothetical protein